MQLMLGTVMEQKKLIIVLADISGYTRFMLDNLTAAVHGQMVINSLIESLIEQVDIPLVLQEIEGDAVFLYAADVGADSDWRGVAAEVSQKLDKFFDAFIKQAALFTESTPCECELCSNADLLGLKIIVHAGEAMFHEIAGRPQVSGPDVILAHRLLKNSIESHEYLLLSEAAFELMGEKLPGHFETYEEAYEGFPNVSIRVRYFQEDYFRERDLIYALPESKLQSAVDNYLDWGRRRIGAATTDQLHNPIREFPWWQKMLARAEVLFFNLAVLLHFRKAITKSILVRGERRVFAHNK